MRIARKLALIALTVILIITGAVPAFADTQVKDQGVFGKYDNLTWTLYDDGTLVISGEGEMDYSGSESKPAWSRHKKSINRVEIKKGVTSIRSEAFEGCKNVTDIVIPEGIKSIDSLAFSDCSSLKEIKLPQSLLVIGNMAFNNCTGLTEIRIPDNVEYLNPYIFTGCTALKKIWIPKTQYKQSEKFWIAGDYTLYVTGTVYKPDHGDRCAFDLRMKDGTSAVNHEDGIRISWKNVSEADSYTVYRQTLRDGKYEMAVILAECGYNCTSYIDKSARRGVTYRYHVFPSKTFYYAPDISECFSGKSSEKVVCRRLSQPEKVSVKAQSGSRISWSRVKGAAGYQIYRKASDDSEYRKIATVKGYTYTDRNISRGKTYEYKVRAYYKNSSGRYFYSPYSESVKYRIRA